MSVVDRPDARVADGGSADVGPEVFDDVLSCAERLDIHAPVTVPELWINRWQILLACQLIESVPEASSKGASHERLGSQEGGTFDGENVVLLVQPRTRNDGMEVGMKEQSLIPCVQDQGEPGGGGPQGTLVRQGESQSMGGGIEEHAVDVLGEGGEEEGTQFAGQGEGDHEVGRTDTSGQFTLDPLLSGGLSALRAGPMIAGMKPKLADAAGLTGMEMPAHGRGATMSDGPEGSALCGVQAGTFLEKVRQEPTQCLNDRGSHGEGAQSAMGSRHCLANGEVVGRGFQSTCDSRAAPDE